MPESITQSMLAAASRSLTTARQTWMLNRVQRIVCDPSRLAGTNQWKLAEALAPEAYADEWGAVEREIMALSVSDAGGSNPGDRRAIYYLIRHLRLGLALEVGTHVGAATARIAAALRQLKALGLVQEIALATIDLDDVNDPVSGRWVTYNSSRPPREVIKAMNCENFVTFHSGGSLRFFAETRQRFDLIFLDGDHTATTVYQEIPAALRVLKEGGWILLHDYFPELKPLWREGIVVPGPFLGVKRLQAEGVAIRAVPLGDLPWPTKFGSHTTSLALLGRG